VSRQRSVTTLLWLVIFVVPLLLQSGRADAITASGVDFTDPVAIDSTPATDLVLTTTEDVYVFVPNGLFADTVILEALEIIFAPGTTVDVNNLLLCTINCPLDSHDLSVDVLLRVLEPVGNLEVRASGSIVVSLDPIPEPSTALLLATGVVTLAGGRRRRFDQKAPRLQPSRDSA